MKTIMRVQPVGLTKFNNAEYVNFSTRFLDIVKKADTGSKSGEGSLFGIEAEDIAQYEADLKIMNDLVAQSRISDHTKVLSTLDKDRCELVVYMIGFVRACKISPEGTTKMAATSLYNVLKPYVGCQRLPNQQKTVQINGLLNDIKKEGPAACITQLGLDEMMETLEEKNSEYAQLITQRTTEVSESQLEESKAVRARMDEYYDYMSAMMFAQNMVAPSEEKASFIRLLNTMIDELSALYNQRMAQSRKNKKEDE